MSRRYALEFAPKALRALRKLDRPVVERSKDATSRRAGLAGRLGDLSKIALGSWRRMPVFAGAISAG